MRILRTKLYAPRARPELVQRPRLLAQLNAGLTARRKLSLVSAPAGYGKTTLITEWLSSGAKGGGPSREAGSPIQVTWLSLDADDNDPARFMSYLLAAFRCVDATVGQSTEDLLETTPLPPLTAIVDELLNDLIALETLAVLVLDDYHVITNPSLHETLAYFIQHQPDQVHLTLTTRDDPPLPLARLRARAQLTEIRARDLRFTLEEASQFFRQSMHLELDTEALETLEARTEGWVVGLQLAALALQHMPDRQDFLADFGGSHRYVIDYLAEEVVRQQDEATRQFLYRTSILERLCGPLCDALLKEEDGSQPSDLMLQDLEKANLFLIPMDGERKWYRYHHLFADYLRTLLSETERTSLSKKAAAWHEANGLTAEAVRYARMSGDEEFAADVLERALSRESTWSSGDLAQWSAWLEALPQHVFPSRPHLSLNASQILYLSGDFERAEARLVETEHVLAALPPTEERTEMVALAALYRGSIAAVRGECERAIAQITFAQERLPQQDQLAHARAFFSLGLAHELADQTESAVENYLKSVEAAGSAGVLSLSIHGLCAAAQVQIRQGRLHRAEQRCQSAIQLAGGAHLPPLGLAWSILGVIALERNELTSAEKLLQDGMALSRQGGLLDDIIFALAYLARLHAYRGDINGALATMEDARSMMQSYGIQRMDALVGAYQARLQLYLGQEAAAVQWAEEIQPLRTDISHEFVDMTLARVSLATDESTSVPALLHPLLEKATAAGRTRTRMEALLMLGLYHHAQGDVASAVDLVKQALRLAAPEGYVRLFLDEGRRLLDLLPQARSAAPEFVDLLLGAIPSEDGSRAARLANMPDPLTDQELRVLELLAAGKSNRDIAGELFISVGTAKWHVHNVLQKLGVSNRAQAAIRAYDLGLV